MIELVQAERLGVVFDQKRDNFHVLTPAGYYETYPCSLANLAKVIDERGMSWLVPTSFSMTILYLMSFCSSPGLTPKLSPSANLPAGTQKHRTRLMHSWLKRRKITKSLFG